MLKQLIAVCFFFFPRLKTLFDINRFYYDLQCQIQLSLFFFNLTTCTVYIYILLKRLEIIWIFTEQEEVDSLLLVNIYIILNIKLNKEFFLKKKDIKIKIVIERIPVKMKKKNDNKLSLGIVK